MTVRGALVKKLLPSKAMKGYVLSSTYVLHEKASTRFLHKIPEARNDHILPRKWPFCTNFES